ncbi:MAG: hypothetical protein HY843_07210 [Bdellovibrio sp.]|nr:hypothetical protein [Bdellovibrio sp.]
MNVFKSNLNNKFIFFISLAGVIGFLLRVVFLDDMEFKEDEHYNFIQTTLIGKTDPWPCCGLPSGVYLANPGMSIWAFVLLARLTGVTDPVSLAKSLAIFSWLGILLIIPFVFHVIPKVMQANKNDLQSLKERINIEQKIWLWVFCLAMVNPFMLLYQRKLWPEPFLPLFLMLCLMGWCFRRKFTGAFSWGFLGALVGQIHMSGFFSSAGFFLWTLVSEFKSKKKTNWLAWVLGTVFGVLPMIPWLIWVVKHPLSQVIPKSISEMLQLKFWVFWISDPTGFHLGNPLGLGRGNSTWAQISDFICYPIVGGYNTYINGIAHVIILFLTVKTFWWGIKFLLKIFQTNKLKNFFLFCLGKGSDLRLAQGAMFWGFGILMTLTGVMIRRYYMVASFPFEFVFLVRAAFTDPKRASKIILPLLWFCELVVSVNFIGYVHVNKGAVQGDYGKAFHVIKEENLKITGKPWADHPLQYYSP